MEILLPKIIAIVGPTATGKSDLAVQLAQQFSGEVISADSRQVYRGLDIGSGKITHAEMQGVPHHLLDVADPHDRYTVVDYQCDALAAIADITARGKLPILCGGTGFYMQSITDNVTFVTTKISPEFRAECEEFTTEELFAQLETQDPRRAQDIDKYNRVRIIRALEIIKDHGYVPEYTTGSLLVDTLRIGITASPERLKQRIHDRLLRRIDQGMLDEVQKLHAAGLSWQRLDELGLEYRYCALHLQGKLPYDTFVTTLAAAIWQYAKRQMTWFKRDTEITWFSADAMPQITEHIKSFVSQCGR